MSYILDALKKADAQRERDPARGIHAQAAIASPVRPRESYRPWLWAAAAVAGAALLSAGWYLFEDEPSLAMPATARAPVTAAAPVAVPSAPAMSQSVAPAPLAAAPQVATAVLPPPAAPRSESGADPRNSSQPMLRGRPQLGAAPASAPMMAATPAPATPAAATAAPAAVAQPASPDEESEAPRPARRSRARAAAPAAAPAAASTPAVASTPAAAVAAVAAPTTGGLPPDAPKFAISGGVYSSNPAQRMLIVNGQVVNEGADLGSGVVLDEIKPKAAVLKFRGTRYTVGF